MKKGLWLILFSFFAFSMEQHSLKDPIKVSSAMDLHEACLKGDVSVVQEILKKDKRGLTIKDEKGFFPIHKAFATEYFVNILGLILDADPKLVNQCDEHGNSPFIHLFFAALNWKERFNWYKPMVRAMEYIGIFKKNIDEEEKFYKNKFQEGMHFLISRGANLELRNGKGNKWEDAAASCDPDNYFSNYIRTLRKQYSTK